MEDCLLGEGEGMGAEAEIYWQVFNQSGESEWGGGAPGASNRLTGQQIKQETKQETKQEVEEEFNEELLHAWPWWEMLNNRAVDAEP